MYTVQVVYFCISGFITTCNVCRLSLQLYRDDPRGEGLRARVLPPLRAAGRGGGGDGRRAHPLLGETRRQGARRLYVRAAPAQQGLRSPGGAGRGAAGGEGWGAGEQGGVRRGERGGVRGSRAGCAGGSGAGSGGAGRGAGGGAGQRAAVGLCPPRREQG